MILQALYQLAQSENLLPDPDFEPKLIAYLIRVGQGGTLIGIESTKIALPSDGKKKAKPIAKTFLVPREGGRTSGDRAFFLYDKSEYVLGKAPVEEGKESRDGEKLHKRFDLFRDKVKQCAEQTNDEAVNAVLLLLNRFEAGEISPELSADCDNNDLFAFVYAPDIDILVTDRPAIKAYWKSLRNAGSSDATVSAQCLVTGQFCSPSELFPMIKKVPGGSTSGVGMVSFNSRAFESHEWSNNENAPISREAAEACSTALNRLVHPSPPNPSQPELTLDRRNIQLSDDTVACYWCPKSKNPFVSVFSGLMQGNPDQVGALYHSIWNGKEFKLDDDTPFYALTLTGTQGRLIVRDWFESTVKDVEENLRQHFKDLKIERLAPPGKDKERPPVVPLGLLLEALAPPAKQRREAIPAHLSTQFFHAGLSGGIYPYNLLQRAVERYRVEIGNEHDEGADGWRAKNYNDARAAMIKAVLNRNKRRYPNRNYEEVKTAMDPNNNNEGYVLGQLMAVLERIQQQALENVNASVVDRYFSAASASPKTVFVRLMKNARHHVRKAMDNEKGGGMAFLLDKMLDELASRFTPKNTRVFPAPNSFPAFLDLDQQGLFVLGYHHMRKWLWMTNEERLAWEHVHADAPRAYRWKTAKEEKVAAVS